jgi:DNA-binding LacI/PurR family transcriptional regulator
MSEAPRQGRRSDSRRSVTIRDVARLSGVSTATVTRVLQGNPSVKEETRHRVKEAVGILGYRPDGIARALVTRTSNSVGMLLPSSGDAFWGGIAEGIEARANQAGFSVLFGAGHADIEREAAMIELFLGKRVDGIVVAGSVGNPDLWFAGSSPPVPVVLVNSDTRLRADDLQRAESAPPEQVLRSLSWAVGTPGMGQVAFDDIGGTRMLVQDLLQDGHRRFAFVGGEPVRPTILRILGFRLALGEAGIEPMAIVSCAETMEAGREVGLDLLRRPERPTAVIAYSDVVAIGVLRATHELGIHVPEDISVAGFDDIEVAAYVEPPLTTVAQPKHEMGRLAMDLVLEALDANAPLGSHDVPGSVIHRGSTGPAPG